MQVREWEEEGREKGARRGESNARRSENGGFEDWWCLVVVGRPAGGRMANWGEGDWVRGLRSRNGGGLDGGAGYLDHGCWAVL